MSGASVVEDIFLATLEKGTPEERAAYLDKVCKDDGDLRRRVERLLEAHPRAGGFLEGPARPAGEQTVAYGPTGEQVGTVIAGRYKLLEQIGEGGMGSVWVAEQTQPVRRKVALKLIKAGMDSKTVLSRFEAERQALALMDHPNIAKVLDGGTTAGERGGVGCGRPFFAMEYVKGVPFTRYCDDARLSVAARLALFVPVCQAVQHAHQKGIIHRDLKPSNILVCLYDGVPVPKVIDFGLAKAMHQPLTEHTLHTAHGVMMGTPLYMSPEQAEFNNLDVDTRTDVYALGVILYELLTGTTPLEKQRFQKTAWHEMLRLIKEEEPQRPSARLSGSGSLPSLAAQRQLEPVKLTKMVRGELDWIVMKCLEKERSRRYETANGLARDLERYLHDEVVEAQPPSAGYRLRKLVRRNKGRVLASGLLATMLFLMIGLILYGAWWADRQSAQRRHEQALVATRDNDAVQATLDRIEDDLIGGRIAEAGALLEQAHQQITEQTTSDLRERHQRLTRDQRMVRELDDIFEERWMISPSDTQMRMDNVRAKRRYPALYQGYDLDVAREPAAQIVERIQRSSIADALSSGMTEWFFVEPKYPNLLMVVDLLDPDPARATLRGGIVKDENDRVKAIATTIDGSRLEPAYAIGLATHPAVENGLRILKAAWTTHPNSFPLALTISSHTCWDENLKNLEAVGWLRTAVALRPSNALAHYYFAVALCGRFGRGAKDRADFAGALDELERTIQFAPWFAKAYGLKALLHHMDGQTLEALAAARKAIKLDSHNLLGLFVIYVDQLFDKKDYVEAARMYRRFESSAKSALSGDPSDGGEPFAAGYTEGSFSALLKGLIGVGHPFEAYRLVLDGHPPQMIIETPVDSGFYIAVLAAALAGTGRGSDAPPPAERPAIRKHALEWLKASLEIWKKNDEAALRLLCASTAGLMASPFGYGPLLLPIAALSLGGPYAFAGRPTDRTVIHDGLEHWLKDADLAGVRDEPLLAQLPTDEHEQWRKLWDEVRSLRDRTAPGQSPAKP